MGPGTERTDKARTLGIRNTLNDDRPAGFTQLVQHWFWRRDQLGRGFRNRLDGRMFHRCTFYGSLAAAFHRPRAAG